MPAQIGSEVDLCHATMLSRQQALTSSAQPVIPKIMKRRALFLLPLLVTAARAHSIKAGSIKIGHAWALPSLAGQDGQCFMPILNTGNDEALVSARADVCSTIEMRRNARYDDPQETQFELKQNKPFPMRPQAFHLRLVGLQRELKLNDRFKLILDFLNTGEVELEVYVEKSPGE
jgi:periplasmic copper chaperone A